MVKLATMFIFVLAGLTFLAAITAITTTPQTSPAVWLLAGVAGCGFIIMFVFWLLAQLLKNEGS